MDLTRKQFERLWYIAALCIIIASLPFSKYGQSFGQFMMAGGWIVERFNTHKFKFSLSRFSLPWKFMLFIPYSVYFGLLGIGKGFIQFSRNRPALIFSSILLFHLIGLIFTTDFDYAFKDIRTKLPLLLLPLFLSTSEAFDNKGFYRFMILFILAIWVRSAFNSWLLLTQQYIDIRDVSRNVSHIILGLLLALGIFSLLRFSLKKNLFPGWSRILFVFMIVWFSGYLLLSKSFTGLAITVLTLIVLIPIYILKAKNRWLKTGLLFLILLFSSGIFFYFRSMVHDFYKVNPVDFSRMEQYTSRGNRYIHNIYSPQTENGNYLWIYIQWDELRDSWNKRSNISFDSTDKKKQPVAYTLVRFLTSKGWHKDADAVEKLTASEIGAIEKGVANVVFLEEFTLRGRVYEFLHGFETYRETGNPTGSTLMQRLEFWKASLGLIRENWILGVGTGDMNVVFHDQYKKMGSKLAPDQWWRSHNQFLSIFIGFGIWGLLWFLFAIIYPPLLIKRQNDYFMLVFLTIAFLSMLTEDTIESQTGVVFFSFFYSFFLFARKEADPV